MLVAAFYVYLFRCCYWVWEDGDDEGDVTVMVTVTVLTKDVADVGAQSGIRLVHQVREA